MSTVLRAIDRRRVFGSLNDATDVTRLAEDQCPVFRNVEHGLAGAITKRLGRTRVGEIATQPEYRCAPLIYGVNDAAGGLDPDQQLSFRVTYVTSAGETDDRPDNTWSATPGQGNNALDIFVPFHVRKATVTNYWRVDPGPSLPPYPPAATKVVMIALDAMPPVVAWTLACPDIFKGWLLYSRAPRIQDETHFGANFEAKEPLYHRIQPLAKVFSFGFYDPGTGNVPVFVLDRDIVQIGQTGKVDRDTVDLMMDDRAGLPILYVNIYASTSQLGPFHYVGSWYKGNLPFRMLNYDAGTPGPPSERVDRAAPATAAELVTDHPGYGCTPFDADTGILGDLYETCYTWSTAAPELLLDPGWPEGHLAGYSACRPGLGCPPEAWPSLVSQVMVQDGQGIRITRPPLPEDVRGWNAYAGPVPVKRALDWNQAGNFDPGGSPWFQNQATAIYAGREDLTDAAAEAIVTEAEVLTDSPQDAWNSTGYGWFAQTSVIQDNALDPWDAATRGFRPSYQDFGKFINPDDNLRFFFASSRDGIRNNRFITFQFLDAVTDQDDLANTTHGVIEFRIRVRPGKLSVYNPSDNLRLSIRLWNEGAGQWVVLRSGIGPTDGAFRIFRCPFAWDTSFFIVDGAHRYPVFDVVATGGVGFDVSHVPVLELKRATTDVSPVVAHMALQVRLTSEPDVVLQNPLARANERNEVLRQNPTAQWEVRLHEAVGAIRGSSRQYFGAADSVFQWGLSCGVERVYQQEGDLYTPVVGNPWRFANYYNRIFAVNPGKSDYNIRFDGIQTWPWGIATPTEKGRVAGISEPAPGDLVTEDMPIQYYLVYLRKLEALGRGYVVRSAPFIWTDTVKVNVKQDTASSIVIEGTVKPEPQVTHVEIYRNYQGSGTQYGLVIQIPITDDIVNADGSVAIHVEDVFDGTDGDLTLDMEFRTGRPPAAIMLVEHLGRVFFVQQKDPTLVAFTNVTSPWGVENPEGFYPFHTLEPPMLGAAITCLKEYAGSVVAHSIRGMVAVSGISDDQNSPQALSPDSLFADTGWVSPEAAVSVNNVQFGMTNLGPARLQGQELEYIGFDVRGTLDRIEFTDAVKQSCYCVQNLGVQRTQVWFVLPSKVTGCADQVLVLDEESLPEGVRHYWAKWTEMQMSSVIVSRDYSGRAVMYMGGQTGRIYRYGGRARTDAGLFIDAEANTKPFTEAELGKASEPRFLFLFTHGDRADWILTRIRKDMRTGDLNPQPMRVKVNSANFKDIGQFPLGGGHEWGLPDEHLESERHFSLGHVLRQMQLGVYQKFSEMPVGSPREQSFQIPGYVLAVKPLDGYYGRRP